MTVAIPPEKMNSRQYLIRCDPEISKRALPRACLSDELSKLLRLNPNRHLRHIPKKHCTPHSLQEHTRM